MKPYLDQIHGLTSKNQLPALLAQFHLRTQGNGMFFGFGSNQDFGDSSQVIAFATAGGLGLPDRDYYTQDRSEVGGVPPEVCGPRAADARTAWATHPTRRNAKQSTIMAMETASGQGFAHPRGAARSAQSLPQGRFGGICKRSRRVSTGASTFANPASVSKTRSTSPSRTSIRNSTSNSRAPASTTSRPICAGIRVHAAAPSLSSAFVNEDFDFFSKTLRGVPQLRPRWKRCVSLVDRQLGEALGQEFVSRAFSPELKQKALTMTTQIEQAMADGYRAAFLDGTRDQAECAG